MTETKVVKRPKWADKAMRLRQQHLSLSEIKERLGLNVALGTIRYWTDPEARERWGAHNRANWPRYYVHKKRRLRRP